MTLASVMQDDVDRVFLNTEEHAEPFVYRPANGAPRTIDAIVTRVDGGLQDETHHTTNTQHITVQAKRSITTGIHSPAMGDLGVWDDLSWDFEKIVESCGGMIVCRFKHVSIETSGSVRAGRL